MSRRLPPENTLRFVCGGIPILMSARSAFQIQFESYKSKLYAISKRRSFKYGLPFILFVVGGSFGLKEWTQIRYQFSTVKGVTKEEAEKMGLHKEHEVTLENAYEEIQKLDIDNWENKRGPRPWESSEKVDK